MTRSLSSKEQHMHICPQPDVIGQIPANVIWIGINDDFIAIPQPARAKLIVIRSYAEVKTVKPEA